MEKELLKIWQENGYVGPRKLFSIVKLKHPTISFKFINDFVNSQDTSQLHKVVRRNKKKSSAIVTPFPKYELQIDLADYSNYAKQNNGYHWILMSVDIFSRKAFAEPVKSKKPIDVLEALKKIFLSYGYTPAILRTDDGGEWKSVVSTYLKEKKVFRVISQSGDHNVLGIIDNFTKQLKGSIEKHFTENNTNKWVDYLKTYITSYNNRPHDALNDDTPNGAEKHTESTLQVQLDKINVTEHGLKVGDNVRIKLKKHVLSKGYTRNWSIKTYKITEVQGNWYLLSNGIKYKSDKLQKVLLTVGEEPIVKPLELVSEKTNEKAKEAKKLKKL